jgi:hypothetical protein
MIPFDPPSDAAMAELREKHGDDLRIVEDGDRVFILAKPEGKLRGYVDRFVATASNERKRLEATEQLVKACCVFPEKDTLRSVLEDEPGLALALAEPATELLGIRQLTVKK